MLVRVVLVLLVGLGLLGLVGAFLLSQQQAPAPAPVVNAPPPPARILVTARPARAGALLVPEDLESAAIEEEKIPTGAMRDLPGGRLQLRGAMMRRTLSAGEPFMAGDFLSPGDRGFLAAVLEPGMRAVTIGVDAVSGTAGLIWPGDHVDLLLTQTMQDQSLPTDHRVSGETVMEDVRVIAVDQQLVQGAQSGANGQQAAGNRTITLEVSPVDAERVEVAGRIGALALTVHSATQPVAAPGEPTVTAEPPQPVFAGDVSAALRQHGPSKSGSAVKVFRGTGDPVEYRF
jgi:pilus assembly protein CpaB